MKGTTPLWWTKADRAEAPVQRTFFRREFKTLYKPFDGRIYLLGFYLECVDYQSRREFKGAAL